MGKPSDTLISSIKWFNFLSSFMMLGVGSVLSLIFIMSPQLLMTAGMPCAIVLAIALLFKVIEQLLIVIYLPDTWGIFTTLFFMCAIFLVLFIVAFKSYLSLDTFKKVSGCLLNDAASSAIGDVSNMASSSIQQANSAVAGQVNAVTIPRPPQNGYPPQGYPPQGYTPQGYPPQGYPPQGYPPQGYPTQPR